MACFRTIGLNLCDACRRHLRSDSNSNTTEKAKQLSLPLCTMQSSRTFIESQLMKQFSRPRMILAVTIIQSLCNNRHRYNSAVILQDTCVSPIAAKIVCVITDCPVILPLAMYDGNTRSAHGVCLCVYLFHRSDSTCSLQHIKWSSSALSRTGTNLGRYSFQEFPFNLVTVLHQDF